MPAAAAGARLNRGWVRLRRVVRVLTVRPRLLAAIAFALVVLLVLPAMRASTRVIVSWDLGVLLYLVLVFVMMATATHAKMQRRADREDVGAAVVLGVAVAAAIASLVAIGFELHGIHDTQRAADKTFRLVLVGVTILQSWTFVHTMFALHYAHEYYVGDEDRGGLSFPGGQPPDYWDFLYFSFTMGAASQTSDVAVPSSRMRRFVLAHTVVSFLFNTTILALAINVGASLL